MVCEQTAQMITGVARHVSCRPWTDSATTARVQRCWPNVTFGQLVRQQLQCSLVSRRRRRRGWRGWLMARTFPGRRHRSAWLVGRSLSFGAGRSKLDMANERGVLPHDRLKLLDGRLVLAGLEIQVPQSESDNGFDRYRLLLLQQCLKGIDTHTRIVLGSIGNRIDRQDRHLHRVIHDTLEFLRHMNDAGKLPLFLAWRGWWRRWWCTRSTTIRTFGWRRWLRRRIRLGLRGWSRGGPTRSASIRTDELARISRFPGYSTSL